MALKSGRSGVKNTLVDRYGNYIGEGGGYELPPATADSLGGIKVGARLSINSDGTLSADAPPEATTVIPGVIIVGEGLEIGQDGKLNVVVVPPEYPIASKAQFGIVKIGDNINVNNGVISVVMPEPYSLPTASANQLGGIKVGDNLSIDANGVLSATGGGDPYVLPIASASVLGGVKVSRGLAIDGSGLLYIRQRTYDCTHLDITLNSTGSSATIYDQFYSGNGRTQLKGSDAASYTGNYMPCHISGVNKLNGKNINGRGFVVGVATNEFDVIVVDDDTNIQYSFKLKASLSSSTSFTATPVLYNNTLERHYKGASSGTVTINSISDSNKQFATITDQAIVNSLTKIINGQKIKIGLEPYGTFVSDSVYVEGYVYGSSTSGTITTYNVRLQFLDVCKSYAHDFRSETLANLTYDSSVGSIFMEVL